MNYSISNIFTEKLDISAFKDSFADDKIKLIGKFNTSISHSKNKGNSKFIMEFTIKGVDEPIYLNWVGIAIFNCQNSDSSKVNEDILLNDKKIKKFISDSFERFSFFLGGELPDIYQQMGKKK